MPRAKDKHGHIMVETRIDHEENMDTIVYRGTWVANVKRYKSCLECHNTSTLDKCPNCGKNTTHKDTFVQLNTGGYFTVTTKKRMNQFAEMFGLDFRVYQKNKIWYVESAGKTQITPWVKEFTGNTCSFTI